MEEFNIEITIICKENFVSAFEISLDEAVKKIKEGYYSGADGNEDESYSFSVKKNTNP